MTKQEAKAKLTEFENSPEFRKGLAKLREEMNGEIEHRQKYIWYPLTKFEAKILESLPIWRGKKNPKPSGDQTWKACHILTRAIERRKTFLKP